MKPLLTFEDKWNEYSALNEQDIDNIFIELGYPNILISAENAKNFNINRIISRQTFRDIDKCINRLERLRRSIGKVPIYILKSSRNQLRKSKSHFRKI